MRQGCWILLSLFLLLAPLHGQAKGRVFHVSFTAELQAIDPFSEGNRIVQKEDERAFARGEPFRLVLRGKTESPWYTYPITLANGQNPAQGTQITFKSDWLIPVGKPQESAWEVAQSPEFGAYHKYKGEFSYSQVVYLDPKAPEGAVANIEAVVALLTCDPNTCVNERHTVRASTKVAKAEVFTLTAEQEKAGTDFQPNRVPADYFKKPVQEVVAPPPSSSGFDWRSYTVVDHPEMVGSVGGGSYGLLGTILAGLIGGFISLATPCVFPMIPVTVSIFLKQAEKQGGGSPVGMALLYSATIVVMLTAGGIALVSVLQVISQHWVTNFLLAALFIFFALSLLGMYEIELPTWLSDLTSTRENQSSAVGIIFMALTFSIISFACVGPIYGGFITLEASNSSSGWLHRILGPLAFSVAFATPFFFLALFPTLLKSMPKSGSWMNTIKVVMGFLELAAAFKFIRAGEVNFLSSSRYFTYDLTIGIYVALALACGLYLLGMYRLPHDSKVDTIGVPRLLFALTFLSLAFYLMPSILKDDKGHGMKPRGVVSEWTRAFLLPDDPSEWHSDLAIALAEADRDGKAVFLDFTGMG